MRPQSFPRRAGVALPLFALRGQCDAGSGTIPDLLPFIDWLAEGRQRILQLLPLNECAVSEMSPYTTLSAFAVDPECIGAVAVVDVQASDAAQAWLQTTRVQDFLARMRRSRRRWRRTAHAFQRRLLEIGFAEFERSGANQRRGDFERYCDAQAPWLDSYAVFRALHEQHGERPWWEWPAADQDGGEVMARGAAAVVTERIRFIKYIQWTAAQQWAAVRHHAAERGVALKGDLTFVCGRDSADVWANRDQFDPTSSAGAPPDAFSATGQKWDLPLYRWERMRARNFDWWRARVQHAAAMYDLVRIDHVVGLFRTYAIPIVEGGTAGFTPADEAEQRLQGIGLMDTILQAASPQCAVVAEDLGTVPEWVRAALTERRIPGYKVFRWEMQGDEFIDPRGFPELSIATTSTHDTDTLAQWLAELDVAQRQSLERMLGATNLESILWRLYEAGSAMSIVPLQDIFGWSDRINVPATSNRQNWSYRLPALEDLRRDTAVRHRWEEAARRIEAAGR